MAIAAPEIAAIIAASKPAPAPAAAPASGGGGAQVLFGLMLLGVGIFLAWLFATGRLKAVQTAIATGVAPSSLIAATGTTDANGITSTAPGGSATTQVNTGGAPLGGNITAPAQAGGVGSVGVTYNPSTGSLTATPALA